MMRSDEQHAFWKAIREAPEEDGPRLVYADWLEEQGEADRAEFIRVQCALDKLGPDRRKGRKERARLEPREQELLAEHQDRWLAPFRAILRGSYPSRNEDHWLGSLKFHRGFVDGHSFGLESARRVAAAGDTVEPVDRIIVAECGMNYRHESVMEIARWPGAGCVLWLSIAWGADGDVVALVESAHLRNLSGLAVWHGKVTDEGMARLAACPLAVRLRSVNFKDNPITDAGAFALAESPYLDQLCYLDLSGTRIGPAGETRLRERFGDVVRLPSFHRPAPL
jgi:uncharacterized protein (TIGR02996 family)